MAHCHCYSLGLPFAVPLLLLFPRITFLSFHHPSEPTWDEAVEPQEVGEAWLMASKIT